MESFKLLRDQKLTFQTNFLSVDCENGKLGWTKKAGLFGCTRREQYTVAGLEVDRLTARISSTVVETVGQFEDHGKSA